MRTSPPLSRAPPPHPSEWVQVRSARQCRRSTPAGRSALSAPRPNPVGAVQDRACRIPVHFPADPRQPAVLEQFRGFGEVRNAWGPAASLFRLPDNLLGFAPHVHVGRALPSALARLGPLRSPVQVLATVSPARWRGRCRPSPVPESEERQGRHGESRLCCRRRPASPAQRAESAVQRRACSKRRNAR